MKNYSKNYHKGAGFTLIEVLITLVVLSIGLLGVAALQAKSQQFSRNAYMHTQATVLAHDMLERMRANPAGLNAGFYDLPTVTEQGDCFSLKGCSLQEMAQNDMYEWTNHVASRLSVGKSVVCIDSSYDDGTPDSPACDGLGSTYVIKVWWNNINATNQRVVTIASF